jgi:hypothetical protein
MKTPGWQCTPVEYVQYGDFSVPLATKERQDPDAAVKGGEM